MLRSIALVAAAVLVFSVASASAAPSPPSGTVIKKLLKKHYLGNDPADYPTTRYGWRAVSKPNRGAPRRGTYWADGVPANTKTIVFPIQLRSRYTVCYPDGDVRVDSINGKYVFFRDEFRDWTFRISDEDRKIRASEPSVCPL